MKDAARKRKFSCCVTDSMHFPISLFLSFHFPILSSEKQRAPILLCPVSNAADRAVLLIEGQTTNGPKEAKTRGGLFVPPLGVRCPPESVADWGMQMGKDGAPRMLDPQSRTLRTQKGGEIIFSSQCNRIPAVCSCIRGPFS